MEDNLDDEFARLVASLAEETEPDPARRALAVVLTPFESAEAVAALCAMGNLAASVVPTPTGAVVARELTLASSPEADLDQLLAVTPPAADQMARLLSRTSRAGVVLLLSELATDVGNEQGLSGHITARQYNAGEPGEEVPVGLVLARMDSLVEDILIGRQQLAQAPGVIDTSTVKGLDALKALGRRRWRFGGR
ncbi:hypothetical protein [Buchananella hordeovulneris]|uniref:Uncharacterized protein n=1 Tax=Buchananella hordeovulneris TaxID=52770 RepID=A0A1Q5PVQ5_9ACTO|nr:hypothetical protein [Buchananella hordeovulneris]OKL51515.1 hypothetical protein BSZ40_06610 [Buchananella hordeovulneris]